MQLPDFINRMLGFATKVETHFDGAEKLAAAEKRIKELEESLSKSQESTKTALDELSSVHAKLTLANTEIETLKVSVETERNRANETIAAQGLTPEQLPVATIEVVPGKKAMSAREEYHQLLKADPRKAAIFYQNNREQIIGSN